MRILFIGHSLIEFFDWQKRFPGHSAENLGVADETTEGLLARIDRIGGAHPSADLIFLMTGLNNISMDDFDFLGSYQEIVQFDQIRENGRLLGQGGRTMSTISDELAAKVSTLPDTEKIQLVDSILKQLDKPDPEIDRIWAEEARKRWQAYKAGSLETVSYEQVMNKHCPR